MKNFIKLGVIAALGTSTATLAAEGPSYSFVEAGYGYAEIASGLFADGDGLAVAGSYELPANVVVAADFNRMDYGLGKISGLSAGLGYKLPLGSAFGVLAGASYEQAKLGGVKEDGFGLSLGTRGFVTDKFELGAVVKYRDLSGYPSAFDLEVSARYYVKPQFSLGVDVAREETAAFPITHYIAKVRYDFGR